MHLSLELVASVQDWAYTVRNRLGEQACFLLMHNGTESD